MALGFGRRRESVKTVKEAGGAGRKAVRDIIASGDCSWTEPRPEPPGGRTRDTPPARWQDRAASGNDWRTIAQRSGNRQRYFAVIISQMKSMAYGATRQTFRTALNLRLRPV